MSPESVGEAHLSSPLAVGSRLVQDQSRRPRSRGVGIRPLRGNHWIEPGLAPERMQAGGALSGVK